jgi:hypothetical protein
VSAPYPGKEDRTLLYSRFYPPFNPNVATHANFREGCFLTAKVATAAEVGVDKMDKWVGGATMDEMRQNIVMLRMVGLEQGVES